ncbi:Cinnamoyl-CoA reductase, variant 2 [Salvia divinorum]
MGFGILCQKALAEKAAWKFAKESGFDIVVVNPVMVIGPVLPPALNSSVQMMVRIFEGLDYGRFFTALVHVKDVALAHVLLYENTSAAGRYLCVESLSRYDKFAEQVERVYPEYKLPRSSTDKQHRSVKSEAALKKLIDLGLKYTPMEQIDKDSIESLRSNGYLS